jgi:hypothetical protein
MKKIQFTVDEETVNKLTRAKDITKDSSLAQTFRRAVVLFYFVTTKQHDGFEVLLKKNDEIYKVFIP